MGKEHNDLGQLIIYDIETGRPIKFTPQEYEYYLMTLYSKQGIEPNYNFKQEIQDE